MKKRYEPCPFMLWLLVLLLVAVASAIGTLKPLPSNLDSLATSPRAIQYLEEANR